MPRSNDGTVSLVAGNPVVTGTTIESNWANTTMADLSQMMQDSLSRTGQGGMLVAFKNLDGTTGNPGITWTNEPSSGFYRSGSGDMRSSIGGVDVTRWTAGEFELWSAADAEWFAVATSTTDYDANQVLQDAFDGNIGKSVTIDSPDVEAEDKNGFHYSSTGVNSPNDVEGNYIRAGGVNANNGFVMWCDNLGASSLYHRVEEGTAFGPWIEGFSSSTRTSVEANGILDKSDSGNIGKAEITSFSGNIQSLLEAGFYNISASASNRPPGENSGSLIVAPRVSANVVHYFTGVVSEVTWVRTRSNSTWGAKWIKLTGVYVDDESSVPLTVDGLIHVST